MQSDLWCSRADYSDGRPDKLPLSVILREDTGDTNTHHRNTWVTQSHTVTHTDSPLTSKNPSGQAMKSCSVITATGTGFGFTVGWGERGFSFLAPSPVIFMFL